MWLAEVCHSATSILPDWQLPGKMAEFLQNPGKSRGQFRSSEKFTSCYLGSEQAILRADASANRGARNLHVEKAACSEPREGLALIRHPSTIQASRPRYFIAETTKQSSTFFLCHSCICVVIEKNMILISPSINLQALWENGLECRCPLGPSLG